MSSRTFHRRFLGVSLAIGLLASGPAVAQTPEQWRQSCENPDLQQALFARLVGQSLVEAQFDLARICIQLDLPDTPVHDTADRSPEATHTDEVLSARYSPDGRMIASGGRDGTVRLWDAETGLPIRTVMVAPTNPWDEDDPEGRGIVRAVEFIGDGTRLAATSETNPARIIDLATGEIIAEITVSPDDEYGGTIAAGGGLLFGGGYQDSVDAYDPQTLAVRHSLAGHNVQDRVVIAVSEAAGLIATADGIRGTEPPSVTVRLWELETGEMVSDFLIEQRGWLGGVAFSRDGKRLAIGVGSHAHVYEVGERTPIRSIPVHPVYTINALAFTADGNGLLTCEAYPILWDIETGEIRHHFGPFRDSCQSIDLSPDGRFMVTAAKLPDVRIWEIETGTFHRRLGINVMPR